MHGNVRWCDGLSKVCFPTVNSILFFYNVQSKWYFGVLVGRDFSARIATATAAHWYVFDSFREDEKKNCCAETLAREK